MTLALNPDKLRLLHLLAEGRPRRSINELARNAKIPVATCWRAVQEFRHLGLVLVERHGNVSLVSLNTRSPATKALLALSVPDPHRMAYESFERRVLRRLPRVRVRLFGSVARGTARPESDVDALVEYRGTGYSKRQVEAACSEAVKGVTDEFMIPVSPLIVPGAEGL